MVWMKKTLLKNPFEQRILYSYLNASIGSNLAACNAGYKPATTPTKIHRVIPENIQSQGITKTPPIKEEVKLPTITPKTIPNNPPN